MARSKTNPVLLISSIDPTGEVGLLKAAILLAQAGITHIAACTAISNQNDIEIDDITWLSYEETKKQLDAVGRRYWIDYAFIFGVQDLDLCAKLIQYLHMSRPGVKIIWEPCFDKDLPPHLFQDSDLQTFQKICRKVDVIFSSEAFREMIHTNPNTFHISTFIQNNQLCIHIDNCMITSISPQQKLSFLIHVIAKLYQGQELTLAIKDYNRNTAL